MLGSPAAGPWPAQESADPHSEPLRQPRVSDSDRWQDPVEVPVVHDGHGRDFELCRDHRDSDSAGPCQCQCPIIGCGRDTAKGRVGGVSASARPLASDAAEIDMAISWRRVGSCETRDEREQGKRKPRQAPPPPSSATERRQSTRKPCRSTEPDPAPPPAAPVARADRDRAVVPALRARPPRGRRRGGARGAHRVLAGLTN